MKRRKKRGTGYTNARKKIYPDEQILQVCNKAIFPVEKGKSTQENPPADEIDDEKNEANGTDETDETDETEKCADVERAKYESRKRAEAAIRDIAKCNKFEYMMTLTLDSKKIDRYSPNEIMKKLRPWLSNMSQRKGFQYLLIPEYHKIKKGENVPAIHFHGLCILGEVEIVPSIDEKGNQRVDDAERPIFNMADWPYGWSTVVPLDEEYGKAVRYVIKYVGKQKEKIFGKYYFASRNLQKRPEIIPIPEGRDFNEFLDEDRIIGGVQSYHTLYSETILLSEKIYEEEEEVDDEQ